MCTPSKKGSTSAVTTAFTRTSTCEYQKGMGTEKKMTRLRKLGI